jgi:hypothetical protein
LRRYVGVEFRKRLSANDRFLCGEPDNHQLRYQQHTELGGRRSDEYRHHAGDIYIHVAERFHEREPDGFDDLHADGNQRHRVDYRYPYRYRKRAKQAETDDQFLHGQSRKSRFGVEQYAELDNERGDRYCDHAGDVHIHVREWFDERESNGHDHLHADRY